MITFSKLGKYGSFGNQLFQYAALFGISQKLNYSIKIPTVEDFFHEDYNRNEFYFANCFEKLSAKTLKSEDLSTLKHNISYTIPCIFNENLFKIPDHSDIEGYFGSYKFFDHCKEELKKELEFKADLLNKISLKYKEFPDSSFVHIRKGDYTHRPDHHPVLNNDYYNRAFEYMNEEKYLVFSDEISYAKDLFKDKKDINFTYIENNHPFEDFILMSLCKNSIIANSTFSWWAAWLNKNENKKIVAPNKWFGPALTSQINYDDLFPNDWKIL